MHRTNNRESWKVVAVLLAAFSVRVTSSFAPVHRSFATATTVASFRTQFGSTGIRWAAASSPYQRLLHHHYQRVQQRYYWWGHVSKQSSIGMGPPSSNAMMESPAAERNKDPIWNVLESKVFVSPRSTSSDIDNNSSESGGKTLHILEIACGAGVHALYFCSQLLQRGIRFQWYPADMDPSYRSSTTAYIETNPLLHHTDLVAQPTPLTLSAHGIMESETLAQFAGVTFDVILNINMIHISPWDATLGLMTVASKKLQPGGFLVLYGPFKVNGTCVESNRNFDASLRQRDAQWGIRDLEQVVETARSIGGLEFLETVDMPANNLMVLFRRP